MIRIDLGKGAGGKKEPSRATATGFKLPGNFSLPALKFDFKLGILILIAVAFAFLPHLFVTQYQAYLVSQHQLVVKTLQAEDERIKQEIAKFQTFQREMESYEEQKRKVKERLDVVRQLLTLRGTPVNILDAIGQSLPQRVWLGNMDLSLVGQAQISLAGKSYSTEEISDFVDKLNESIHLGDVTLDGVTTAKEGENGGDIKVFQIFATPKGLPVSPSRTGAAIASPTIPSGATASIKTPPPVSGAK